MVTRKLALKAGQALDALLKEVAFNTEGALAELAPTCREIARWMRDDASHDDRLAGSVPFTTMCAVAIGGWQLECQARAVKDGIAPSLAESKPVTFRIFCNHISSEALGLAAAARSGAELNYGLTSEAMVG